MVILFKDSKKLENRNEAQQRFGIGIGVISTEINNDIGIGADGPGYYFARESIDYLKKTGEK